ncbi:hypothetical protein Avbf_08764 [Armadillidium vulgare]|nr:hypothetical protein Avbf_08764 [Armadillidium vulgare]
MKNKDSKDSKLPKEQEAMADPVVHIDVEDDENMDTDDQDFPEDDDESFSSPQPPLSQFGRYIKEMKIMNSGQNVGHQLKGYREKYKLKRSQWKRPLNLSFESIVKLILSVMFIELRYLWCYLNSYKINISLWIILFPVPNSGYNIPSGQLKAAGNYLLGPILGSSPVRSMVQCLGRKKNSGKQL